jgi:hypothetical protein
MDAQWNLHDLEKHVRNGVLEEVTWKQARTRLE